LSSVWKILSGNGRTFPSSETQHPIQISNGIRLHGGHVDEAQGRSYRDLLGSWKSVIKDQHSVGSGIFHHHGSLENRRYERYLKDTE